MVNEPQAVSTRRRASDPRFVWALLFATGLHAAALFWLWNRPTESTRSTSVTQLTLEWSAPALPDSSTPRVIRERVVRPPIAPTVELSEPGGPARPDEPTRDITPPPTPQAPGGLPIERRPLRDSPRPADGAPHRELGAPPVASWPNRWDRPLLPQRDHLFERAALPSRTEVLDRWQDTDGTRHVVLHTTNGRTLCGRTAAIDPMDQLVGRLMSFRECGGGGPRDLDLRRVRAD